MLARLRGERSEIEVAIQARVRDAAPGRDDESAEYEAGQYAAIVEALDYTLEGIEHGVNPERPIPPAAMEQARRAARHEVSLDTVLRRYHAAQSALAARIRAHIERDALSSDPAALRMLVELQELHNLLTAEVAAEYAREVARIERSPADRRAGRIEQLLSGASSDTRSLDYELEGFWHTCVIAVGETASSEVDGLARELNRNLLAVPRSGDIVWAWLGGSRPVAVPDGPSAPRVRAGDEVSFAVGEPQRGLDGWRLTYKQAQAALRIALLAPAPLTRYRDVALVEAIARDQSLALAYVDVHLAPLDRLRITGSTARETLVAFFSAGMHIEHAAGLLHVNRCTMRERISKIEASLGYPLSTHHAELEVALRVERLLMARSQRARSRRRGGTHRPRVQARPGADYQNQA